MIREEEGAGVTRDGKLNYDDLYIYVTTVIIGSSLLIYFAKGNNYNRILFGKRGTRENTIFIK